MVLVKFSDRKRLLVKSSASMGRSDIEWKSCGPGGGGSGLGCYWDGEIVLDPPEIKINDVQ